MESSDKVLFDPGYAPIVIPIEDRAAYLNMLADQDVMKLADYLERKNVEEEEQMNKFGIQLENIDRIKRKNSKR